MEGDAVERIGIDGWFDEGHHGGDHGGDTTQPVEMLPAFDALGEVSPWVPKGIRHSQCPKDGELIQELSYVAQGHVEVHGEDTYTEEKARDEIHGHGALLAVLPVQVQQGSRKDEEAYIADRVVVLCDDRRAHKVVFTPVDFGALVGEYARHRWVALL